MGDGDREDGALHAGKKDARAVFDFHGNIAAFVALALVLHEARPVVGAGDDAVEVAHHLAAVAHAESEGIGALEERRELGAGAFVKQDALGPAFAGAEYVAVAEAAARSEAAKIFE